MFFSTTVRYRGVLSTDVVTGLLAVNPNTGLTESNTGINRTIIEEKVPYHDTPYLYRVDKEPDEVTIYFAKDEPWTWNERKAFSRWLTSNSYEELEVEDFPCKFKAIAQEHPKFFNNGLQQGYYEVNFRIQGFGYSEGIQTFGQYDLPNNPVEGTEVVVTSLSNLQDEYFYPEVEFTTETGTTEVEFINLSDGGRTTKVIGLSDNETFYMNGQNKRLESTAGTNQLDKLVNKLFFRLVEGDNRVIIKGKINNLTIQGEYPVTF